MTSEESTMIEDCENRSAKMSDWECVFVDSISRRLGVLSQEQYNKLSDIWERVTEDG